METASHARHTLTSHSLETSMRTTYLSTTMHSMKRSRHQNKLSIVSTEYLFDLNCHTLLVLWAEGPGDLWHHSACSIRHWLSDIINRWRSIIHILLFYGTCHYALEFTNSSVNTLRPSRAWKRIFYSNKTFLSLFV